MDIKFLHQIPMTLSPHGNAKIDATPYRHTQKNTLPKTKDTSGKAKCNETGGILGATSSSELPRNWLQVYNSQCSASTNNSTGGRADPVFELIQQILCQKEENLFDLLTLKQVLPVS